MRTIMLNIHKGLNCSSELVIGTSSIHYTLHILYSPALATVAMRTLAFAYQTIIAGTATLSLFFPATDALSVNSSVQISQASPIGQDTTTAQITAHQKRNIFIDPIACPGKFNHIVNTAIVEAGYMVSAKYIIFKPHLLLSKRICRLRMAI